MSLMVKNAELTDKTFKKLGDFIQSNYGIKMPPAKKIMVQGRLQKRLRKLGLSTFERYCEYVLDKDNQHEMVNLINAVSTNKTDFFREADHFKVLVEKVLIEFIANQSYTVQVPFKIWSAGCSTGEEPYTMAMVLSDFAERNNGFKFQILATDVSTEVLEQGANAVYKMEKVDPVPLEMKRKYMLKSKNKEKPVVRMNNEMRNLVTFKRLNFLDNFKLPEKMDVIFCRNVIIYFERELQKEIIMKFYDHLHPGGYLFLGHSESLNGLDLPFVQFRPTVYQKK